MKYRLVTFYSLILWLLLGSCGHFSAGRKPASATSCHHLVQSFFGQSKTKLSLLKKLEAGSELSFKDQDWLAIYLYKKDHPTAQRILKLLDEGTPLGPFEKDWLHYAIAREGSTFLARIKQKVANAWNRITVSKSMRNFNIEEYFRLRESYRKTLKAGDEVTPSSTFESRLAFIETMNAQNIISKTYRTSYWSLLGRQWALYQILKGLDLEQGLSVQKLQKLMSKLYLLTNKSPQKIGNLFFKSAQERRYLVLADLVQEQLIRHGLDKTLKEKGLLSHSAWREAFKKLTETKKFKVLSTIFLNAHLIEAPIPIYLPKMTVHIPPQTLRKILLAGESGNAEKVFWEEVMVRLVNGEDVLLKSLVKQNDRKIVYNSIRKPLMGLAGIGLTWYLIQEVRVENKKKGQEVKDQVNQAIEDTQATIQELVPASSEEYTNELMEKYIKQLESEKGRALSPDEWEEIRLMF